MSSFSKPRAVPCYGKYDRCKARDCEYQESCKLYSNLPSPSGRSGMVSFDYHPPMADAKIRQAEEGTVYAALTHLFMWMLSVDSYTLCLIQKILIDKKSSISEIAAELNISRQSVHEKMLNTIIKHPELALLFQTVIQRVPATNTYFVKKAKERKTKKCIRSQTKDSQKN